jgi:hypothetical protein
MTRQEKFKAELFELFRKYKVEMSVVEEVGGYAPYVVGINFYSYIQFDSSSWQESPGEYEVIDLTVGKWCDGGVCDSDH